MDIRQSAIARTTRFEGGFIEYFYLDSGGRVTVGIGEMLGSADEAAAVKMKTATGAAANDQQKRAEWATINGKDRRHPASWYQQYTSLKMARADGDALLKSSLKNAADDLLVRFPQLDTYPEDAQDALLDMMFNIGLTKFTQAKWPSLFAAVASKDWGAAGNQCNRPDVPADRNLEIKNLFRRAGGLPPATVEIGAHAASSEYLRSLLREQLEDVANFASGAREISNLFPHGITKICLTIKAGDAELAIDIDGPSCSS